MKLFSPECIWDVAAELGEGPVWLAEERALVFVDIKGQRVHRCAEDGSARQSWAAPQPIGFVQPLASPEPGLFIAGLQDGLYRFSTRSGAFERVQQVDAELPVNRLNDAHVDARGRLWFGTMDDAETRASGSLYRVAADGCLLKQEADGVPIRCTITNGPALSPDGHTFFHTDTLNRAVHAYDLADDGTLSRQRLFARIDGYPDGTAVDAAGDVWIAVFGGARVERYTAFGERLQTVRLPCDNVTKLAFGGPDGRTAFVTTAWKGLTPAQRAAQPLAGGVFSFRSDTPGLPQHRITEGFGA